MLHLFPDVLTIEASGKELRAQPEWKGEILIHGDQNTLLTEDVLVRTLPDGVVERYAVLDVAYQRRYGALPALTTVKVHRIGARNAPGTAAHITHHVTRPNSRVNVSSHEASINTVTAASERLFADLAATTDSQAALADSDSVAQAGPEAAERFLEFFAAQIRNPNTREAYARAAASSSCGPSHGGSGSGRFSRSTWRAGSSSSGAARRR